MNGLREDFTFVDLFAGIGGFHAALSQMGGRCVLAVEKDEAAAKVYQDNWGVEPMHDVTLVDWRTAGRELEKEGGVDVLTAGFPCFPAGTMVLTETGYRPIEDIEVGDKVLTHLGRWRSVTTTMSREYRGALQHIAAQGTVIAATDEHPFWARPRRRQVWDRDSKKMVRGLEDPRWVDASEITAEYYLAQPFVAETEDDPDLTEDFWWVAGRFIGDGWLTTGKQGNLRAVICCSKGEADEVEERISRVTHATRSDERTVVKFYVTRRAFVELLKPFGRGAANKTLTRRELMLPASKAEALLSGYLSADGYVHTSGESATTVSRRLALGMAQVAYRARGVVCSIRKQEVEPTKIIEGRTVNQQPWYRLTVPSSNKSAFTDAGYGWKKVKRSTPIDSVIEVFNISVDEDETYCAEGAVVHNCQPFSKSGAQRGVEDTRGTLFYNVLEAVTWLRPKVVYLENVRNLAGPKHRDTWATIIASLRELGYQVSSEPLIVSPTWLGPGKGTPQNRERVFILGTRVDSPEDALTEIAPTVQVDKWDGTWNLVEELPLDGLVPELMPGESVELSKDEELWFDAWNDFVQTARREGAELPGVVWVDAWELTPEEVLEELPTWKRRFVELNRTWYMANESWAAAWLERWSVSSFPPSRRKLEWQAQGAETFEECLIQLRQSGLRVKRATHTVALVAIDQRPIIGALKRRMTARECARLQGFSEDFTFRSVGPRAAYKQLGNAVCVPVVRWVLERHLETVESLLGACQGEGTGFTRTVGTESPSSPSSRGG